MVEENIKCFLSSLDRCQKPNILWFLEIFTIFILFEFTSLIFSLSHDTKKLGFFFYQKLEPYRVFNSSFPKPIHRQ